ncbi:SDR family NAD(P)-dependent oxidoreductase [Nonomuraea sp. H19]|uniref:SDR family NAD(P)-dependent oxidoreductase n=1 Tax=Nonomuraea sp. H19 TaxID=3452206 RepID=UPI003F8A448D
MHGRVALITGGGAGIGRAVADRLARAGAAVAILDRDVDGTTAAARSVTADGGRALGLACDVTDRAAVEAAVAETVDTLGRLDVLVNNAGVSRETHFEDLTQDDWNAQVGPTLWGAVVCTQVALPHLLAARGGAIVNIGSVNGATGLGHEAYSAAKAGLINLTQNLAVRYGSRGLRVNLLAVGTVRTPAWDERVALDPELLERLAGYYPLARIGEPEDVAAACLFLASDEAAWITGATLAVDGGLLAGNGAVMHSRMAGRPPR